MNLSRRTLAKTVLAAFSTMPFALHRANATEQSPEKNVITSIMQSDPALFTIGSENAPIEVTEWYSLTCAHCANYQKTVFPEVMENLIKTGKIRYSWASYPLDRMALTASKILSQIEPSQKLTFITDLLKNQDRWAFSPSTRNLPEDHIYDELKKIAATYGLSGENLDKIIADKDMETAIVASETKASKDYGINGTPYFRTSTGKTYSTEILTYKIFSDFIGLGQ